MLSQNDRVILHLWERGPLSSLDAMHLDPPIMRLASRVYDIRHKYGYEIPTIKKATSTGGTYDYYYLSPNDKAKVEGV